MFSPIHAGALRVIRSMYAFDQTFRKLASEAPSLLQWFLALYHDIFSKTTQMESLTTLTYVVGAVVESGKEGSVQGQKRHKFGLQFFIFYVKVKLEQTSGG